MSRSNSNSDDYRQNALHAYKGYFRKVGANRINEYLRTMMISDSGEELSKVQNKDVRRICTVIQEIDRRLKPGNGNLQVFRGIPMSFKKAFENTGVLVNKSYTSASTDHEVAKDFGPLVLCFTLPRTIKRHDYSSTSHNGNDYEKEILIERNTQFVGYREEKKGDYTLVYTTIVKWEPPVMTASQSEYKTSLQRMLKEAENEEIDWDAP